jgi:enamine deaminase RidA (YjgF/YER057c/UK114 family)
VSGSDPIARLAAAGHVLPPAPVPRGLYAPTCTVPLDAQRAWVHVSGQTCRVQGVAQAGICRDEADLPVAAAASEIAVLNALAALGAAAQGLQNVLQIVRVRGFIRSTPEFGRHGPVLDGASRILATAFPDHLPPARSAVGVADLPDHAWVEIELEAVVHLRHHAAQASPAPSRALSSSSSADTPSTVSATPYT